MTKYLKEYQMEATIHKILDKISLDEFLTLVESKLKGIVDKIVKKSLTWNKFESKIKKELQSEDANKFIQANS